MILGVGTDIVDERRIPRSLDRFGDRFLNRIFTTAEQSAARMRGQTTLYLAKRFAAKEACSKALGTGLRQGVFWRDMGVSNLPSGKPTMRLTNGALHRLEKITPQGMRAQIDLTITDDFPLAQAIVIISAVPADSEIVL